MNAVSTAYARRPASNAHRSAEDFARQRPAQRAINYGTAEVSRFVTVATHLAVTRQIEDPRERRRVALILNVLGPPLSRTLGYMPGKRLGLGEDIPSGAMLEWGKWAQKPAYLFSDPSMDAHARSSAVSADVLAVGAADDPWATPTQIDATTSHLSNAHIQRRTYTPAELGASAVGHHGLLRRGVGDQAWPQLLSWLGGTESQGPSR